MFDGDHSDKQLEFSHQLQCHFTRHAKTAKGVLLNKNTRCFTSWNERGLIIWNPETMETLFRRDFVSDQIACVCYSEEYHLYFLCTRKLKIKVLNEYLNQVVELSSRVNLIQKCYFIDQSKQLLTAGAHGCFLIDMRIRYKYDPRQAILLDPKGHSIEVGYRLPQMTENGAALRVDGPTSGHWKLEGIEAWAKGLKLDAKQHFLVTWAYEGNAVNRCYFYEFYAERPPHENCRPICDFTNLSGTDDFITDLLLLEHIHYLVLTTNSGRILVFKWDRKSREKHFMHEFKSHTKPITCVNPMHHNQTYIVTAALDGTIKVWCLEKMIELYSFEVGQGEASTGGGGGGDGMESI